MRLRRETTTFAALALAAVVPACGGGDAGADTYRPAVSGSVAVSGSSTVEPVSVRVAERLADVNDGIEVDVDGPGTGDGFKAFCQGDTDITGASRPVKPEEVDACAAADVEFVELEIARDGITVITNTANDVECLSRDDLAALVGPEAEGVDNWREASDELPDMTLEITAPGEESGTYDAFVELALDGEDARKDYTSQANDDAILQGVQGSEGALGWVGFAFAQYAEGLVKSVAVEDDDGECIAPSAETIADGSYPLARPLFIYVNTRSAATNEAVAAYVDFFLGEGYVAVAEVGYVPLGAAELAATVERWKAR